MTTEVIENLLIDHSNIEEIIHICNKHRAKGTKIRIRKCFFLLNRNIETTLLSGPVIESQLRRNVSNATESKYAIFEDNVIVFKTVKDKNEGYVSVLSLRLFTDLQYPY